MAMTTAVRMPTSAIRLENTLDRRSRSSPQAAISRMPTVAIPINAKREKYPMVSFTNPTLPTMSTPRTLDTYGNRTRLIR